MYFQSESYDLQCSPALCNCDVSRGKGVRGDVYTTHSPLWEEELEWTAQTQNNALAVPYTAISNTQETHRIKGSPTFSSYTLFKLAI